MDLERVWSEAIVAAVKTLWGVELGDRHRPFVEPPQDSKFGDATSGVPMRLARDLRKPPAVIAKELAQALAHTSHVTKVEAVGGYVNFTADLAVYGTLVQGIRTMPQEWGCSSLGRGVRALVEHTSANPTGPMHIAHARLAAVGDALANVLAFAGVEVSREFYVNDAGGQIGNLGRSVLWRIAELSGVTFHRDERGTDEEGKPIVWLVGEVGGRRFELLEKNAYRGDYIRTLAGELKQGVGGEILRLSEAEAIERCGQFAKGRLLAEIKEDLARFRVHIDTWYSEAELRRSGKIEAMLEGLRGRGLTYEEEGAVFMRSKDHGDEKDRVLVKRDGEYTYRTPDTAYHRDKFDRGFSWLIDTWGPDHHSEIANRTAGLRALGFDLRPRSEFLKTRAGRCFEVLIIQYCRLLRGGQEVKMGKRIASYVTMRELMDEVGVDAARWFLTMRKTDSPLDFDLDVAKKQSLDNPVYYAQYAHARICSIYRKGLEKGMIRPNEMKGGVWVGEFDPKELGAEEVGLLRTVRLWPRTIERAAETIDPSLLCMYLTGLSGAFQSYYQPGMRDPSKRVIDDGVLEGKRRARLAACAAVQVTLRTGFELLGVLAPEQLAREEGTVE